MTATSRSRSGLTAIDVRHPGHSGEAGVSPENAQSGAFGLLAVVGPGALEHPMTEPAKASRAKDAVRRMGEHSLGGETMMRWPARRDAGSSLLGIPSRLSHRRCPIMLPSPAPILVPRLGSRF